MKKEGGIIEDKRPKSATFARPLLGAARTSKQGRLGSFPKETTALHDE